jgi:hypothetical protein
MYDAMAGAPAHKSHMRSVVVVQPFRSVWPTRHTVHGKHPETSTRLVCAEYVFDGQGSLVVRPGGQYAPAGHGTAGIEGIGQ